MFISCTNCLESSPYSDWETDLLDVIKCPNCAAVFKMAALQHNQEICSNEIIDINPVPAIIERTGNQGKFAWDEFFSGIIANNNTRRSYKRSVLDFLNFLDNKKLELNEVMPGHVREYFDSLELQLSSKKQLLAGLRHFFDVMVTRHALLLNPAASVRLERMIYNHGKTKPLSPTDARRAIDAIELKTTRDLRDRCILGILTYTACRITALRKLTFKDYVINGYESHLVFQEKGGKVREIPARNELRQWLDEYLNFSGISDGPLLRRAVGNNMRLSEEAISESSVNNILKKRLKFVGLIGYTAHSFRAGTATSLLEQLPSDEVRVFLGHTDARTTMLYDYRKNRISQNLVERI